MSSREQGPERIEAERESRNEIQLNWPEKATAAKIEGLVTNSASMLIAIQSSLICGERRLNPMKEKQTCYRLLNRKRRTTARERNSENSSVKSHPLLMYSYHFCLSHCFSLFITGVKKECLYQCVFIP